MQKALVEPVKIQDAVLSIMQSKNAALKRIPGECKETSK
jgi:hypothetical protein